MSIATSLALESACGIHPDIIVERAPILDYEELWVNVRTLFRNFMGSLDATTHKAVVPGQIAEALATEMDTIASIVATESRGSCEVVFYYCNYRGIEGKYRHAVVRRDSTENQKLYTIIHNATIELLIGYERDDMVGLDLKLTPQNHPIALVLTHYAYDLLSWPNFSKLVLLESHTGAIKERALWYTKYHNGKDLVMIPFREDFIQVFGDNETFRPMDLKLRRDLIDIATRYHWTAVSTRDKIKYGIDQLQNPMARDILRDMLV